MEEVRVASGCSNASSDFVLSYILGRERVRYIFGTTISAVNAAFLAVFPNGEIPAGTPLIVACDNSQYYFPSVIMGAGITPGAAVDAVNKANGRSAGQTNADQNGNCRSQLNRLARQWWGKACPSQ